MRPKWLWMDEDELRLECAALVTQVLFMASLVRQAAEEGYERGFADAALRVEETPEMGNATGLVLH